MELKSKIQKPFKLVIWVYFKLFKFFIKNNKDNILLEFSNLTLYELHSIIVIHMQLSSLETPVFPLGIAALRRRNPGEKLVAGSIPLKGHF